jgi:hypothetical protein
MIRFDLPMEGCLEKPGVHTVVNFAWANLHYARTKPFPFRSSA